MHMFKALVATAAILTSSLTGASPAFNQDRSPRCLSYNDASYLATKFQSLITAYDNSVADKLLADTNFKDYSSSIQALQGKDTNVAAFDSKAAFKAGQGAQPPIPLKIDAMDFTCNTVWFQWQATFGAGKTVHGINRLNAVYTQSVNAWQIQTVYSEFDSKTWYENIGGSCSIQSS